MSQTLALDIFGYVSVSTRDNPHFKDEELSHLGGLERARAMYDIRVAVGEVRESDK